MKPVLAWVKTNILIVIAMLVILVPLPVAYFFSAQWNASVRESQQEKLDRAQRTIRGASAVNYQLPAVASEESDLSESRAPNAEVTAWYAQRLAERRAAVEEVLNLAESVNRAAGRPVLGDHRPIVPGLFPGPESQAERIALVSDFFDVVTGPRPGAETIYDRMIQSIGGVGDPDNEELALQLAGQEESLRSRLESDPSRDAAEITEDVQQQLASRRLGAYRAHAAQAGVFMTPDAFHAPGEIPASATPVALGLDDPRERRLRQQGGNPITPAECFIWQWDLWIYADMLAAVDAANAVGSSGQPGVRGAVVKRIDRIAVAPFPLSGAQTATTGPGPASRDIRGGFSDLEPDVRGGQPAPRVNPSEPDSPVYAGDVFHTGAQATAQSPDAISDVRRVTLEAVVASDRLPVLLDQISRTNLMTVVDVDLAEVDVLADLRRGYDYGSDHVVRATILIETTWLRSWTAELMPAEIREVLGVPEPDSADQAEDSEG